MSVYLFTYSTNEISDSKIQISIFHFRSDDIYIAPSAVQKERILPEDMFVQNIEGDDIQTPPEYKK